MAVFEGDGPVRDRKYLTVAKLKQILASLDEDYALQCNGVGNLTVGTQDGTYKGFVDFLAEGYEEAKST